MTVRDTCVTLRRPHHGGGGGRSRGHLLPQDGECEDQCTMGNLEADISCFVEVSGLFVQVDILKHVYHLFIQMKSLLE